VAGTYIGGSAAQIIPDDPLRWLFIAVATYMGWRYLRAIKPADECATDVRELPK